MTTTMIDTIHDNVSLIPVDTPAVAGYVTGSSDICWTASDWGQFIPAQTRLVHINQGDPGLSPDAFDTLDVEAGAITPGQVPALVHARVQAGYAWTLVYGTASTLSEVQSALEAAPYGEHWYWGHVASWLANWNLDEDEAAAQLGTLISGLGCVAVQWASPTSNPGTLLPGTSLTLAESNCDLSVTP
jgi:hypothetical protein